jgi:CsoR family transcriptional regulator, copper-sensing transcriptional repressor
LTKASKKSHGGMSVDHTVQLPRLRRIEGQVRGLQQMIESERNCIEVSHQINAVIAALRRVQGDMLGAHLAACTEAARQGKISKEEHKQMVDEVSTLINRLS